MAEDIVYLHSVKPNKEVLEAEYKTAVNNWMATAAIIEILDIGAYTIRLKHAADGTVALGVMSAQKRVWDLFKNDMKAINATRMLLDLEEFPKDAVGFANALLREESNYDDDRLAAWHRQCNIAAKENLFDVIGEGKSMEFLIEKLAYMTDGEAKDIITRTPKKDDDA